MAATLRDITARLEKDWYRLMPVSEIADTAAGEIIRALNKILYRWYNDGDKINEGYGKETCNPAARFLMEKCPENISIKVNMIWQGRFNGSRCVYMTDSDYEEALVDMAGALLDWLETAGLENVPNTEDMLDWEHDEDSWRPQDDDDDYDDYDDEDD